MHLLLIAVVEQFTVMPSTCLVYQHQYWTHQADQCLLYVYCTYARHTVHCTVPVVRAVYCTYARHTVHCTVPVVRVLYVRTSYSTHNEFSVCARFLIVEIGVVFSEEIQFKGIVHQFRIYIIFFSCLNKRNILYKRSISVKQH